MRHFLNGVEVSPRNRDEIGVVCDFTGNPDVLSLNTDTLVLPREANQMVKQHIQTNGLFIGIPYQVQMEGGITLDYYIDLCDPGSKPMCRVVWPPDRGLNRSSHDEQHRLLRRRA